MAEQRYSIDSSFIEGKLGQLYAIHYSPAVSEGRSECVVVAPAFAEEMNRCRYMCTMLAQSIAGNGVGFLSVDPYGTGDSEGDFGELDWATMSADFLTACQYALELGYQKISLLGVRTGALVVTQVASEVDRLHRILFWQPVTSGQATLTQLLRLKIAGSISRDEDAGSTKEYEALIASGESVEVTGYEISPSLFVGLRDARLESHGNLLQAKMAWFTTLPSAERKPPRADSAVLEKWRSNGIQVDYTVVVGPPYWQVHERALAPALVDATSAYILRDVD
jgi:exosortase A-associated hydrolase 2